MLSAIFHSPPTSMRHVCASTTIWGNSRGMISLPSRIQSTIHTSRCLDTLHLFLLIYIFYYFLLHGAIVENPIFQQVVCSRYYICIYLLVDLIFFPFWRVRSTFCEMKKNIMIDVATNKSFPDRCPSIHSCCGHRGKITGWSICVCWPHSMAQIGCVFAKHCSV